MKAPSRFEVQKSIARHVLFGASALVLIAGGFALWGTMAELSGAVIAQRDTCRRLQCEEGAAPHRRGDRGASGKGGRSRRRRRDPGQAR